MEWKLQSVEPVESMYRFYSNEWKRNTFDCQPGNGSVALQVNWQDRCSHWNSAFWDISVIPTSNGSGVDWSLSIPSALNVCPEPALMIVGKLTRAIVILMELHGEAYPFTPREESKSKTPSWQMLTESGYYPTHLDSAILSPLTKF